MYEKWHKNIIPLKVLLVLIHLLSKNKFKFKILYM